MLRKMGWDADNISMWVVKTRDKNIKHTILVAHIDGCEWLLNSALARETGAVEPIEATPEYMNNTFKFIYRIKEKDGI